MTVAEPRTDATGHFSTCDVFVSALLMHWLPDHVS
jgi:hypothetical protein